MIKLIVQTYNGSPLPQALSASFDELGGTIGRADNNQLVLPDPERSISRVHAQVAFRHGAYAVIDRGSNPVHHNGRPLGNGQEAPLQPGDQLVIGGYLIQVEQGTPEAAGAAGSAADPFADFGGMAWGAAAPTPVSGGMPAPAPADPFAFAAPVPSAPPMSPAPASGGIPDDWDPFAPDPVASSPLVVPAGSAAAASQALIPDMVDLGGGRANTASSLDAMFGLGGGTGADPLAHSPLAPTQQGPNTAGHVDPMQALLDSQPVVPDAAMPDQVSTLHEPFQQAPLSPPKAPPAAPVLSWDEGAEEGRTVIRAKGGQAIPPAPAPAPILESVPVAPPPIPAPAPVPLTAPVSAQPAASLGDEAALLAALASGLGVSLPAGQRLSPEFMQLVGHLLRDATQGTVDLLVARAALKREVRAEVTMIATKENNPLKFSPSGEVALNHLLNPPARGFMPPAQAMRDAYQDLRAHQFAFVAGMRAALEGVLRRFDPSELEGKLTQRSGLSGLLAGSRKARMWELFVELYGQISAEASDDFHELFGKEFLRAYEAHIDQLQRDE